ncbi:hypothetical protein F4778DRAFT_796472 [Xylariomycetidae sp. FL2044]|nr:hypothetical protein F4778DRAFT_796472 [Xylariomycetidae sp. FL2044]
MDGLRYEKLREERDSLEAHSSRTYAQVRQLSLPGRSSLGPWWIWAIHVLLLACYTAAAFVLYGRSTGRGIDLAELEGFEYGPIRPHLKYQREYFDLELGKPSPYAGRGPEVDDAWLAISAPPGKVGTIKIGREDLHAMNLSSTPFADGSGYAVTISVFHQLHCLDMLRKSIISNTANSPLWQEHIDHCIDAIRLSLQCQSDTSLLTFKWLKDYPKPWPDFRSFHTCRDFGAIRKFALDRWFDASEPGLVVHPEMGLFNTSGEHKKIVPQRPYQYIEVD